MSKKTLLAVGVAVLGAAVGTVSFLSPPMKLKAEMSCQELQNASAKAASLKITGCAMKISAATYFYDEAGNVTELYIPVYPVDSKLLKATTISLHTKDPHRLKLVSDMVDVLKSGKDLGAYLDTNSEKYQSTGDFAVRVSAQHAADSPIYAQLKDLDRELAPGFVIYEQN